MTYSRFFLFLLLTSCATNEGVCPQIRTYTKKEQLQQIIAEEKLPDNSPLVNPLLEWHKLRSELKACNGE